MKFNKFIQGNLNARFMPFTPDANVKHSYFEQQLSGFTKSEYGMDISESDCSVATFKIPKRMRRVEYRLDLIEKRSFWLDKRIKGSPVLILNLNDLSKREKFINFFRPFIGKEKWDPEQHKATLDALRLEGLQQIFGQKSASN